MTLFAVHEEDGKVVQLTKTWLSASEHLAYSYQLEELGHKFVTQDSPNLLHPDHWMVDVKGGHLSERPVMRVEVSKTVFKIGENDSVVLKNIPANFKYRIMAASAEIWTGDNEGTELELHSLVPCKWTIHIDRWPYKPWKTDVEAIA